MHQRTLTISLKERNKRKIALLFTLGKYITYICILTFLLFRLFRPFVFSQAETLDHNKTPCSNPQDFIPDTEGKLFVFYIKMMHSADFETWMNIASCFHMWDLDARGFHKSMWRFWIKKNHILVIGCPSSEYCSHKPVNLEPIYIPKKPEVKQ